jgi:LPPG:FO 2-phospho-L-lactate transferase
MSDAPVRTQVETVAGWLDFQRYFVAEQCRPVARAIRFDGAGAAPSPEFAKALERGDLSAVVICPSNPFLSVDPILSLAGVRATLEGLAVPVVAVSPLVGGKAVKGPLSKLLDELGSGGNNLALARHYGGLTDTFVIDRRDEGDAEGLRALGLSVTVTETLMRDAADREALARAVLAAAGLDE